MSFKLNKEGKWQLYDELYAEGQEIFARYNPCQIRKDPTSPTGVSCLGGTGCCQGCEHLGPEGCTVQALSCKLWTCWKLQSIPEHQPMIEELIALKREAARADIPLWLRATKEQTFGITK